MELQDVLSQRREEEAAGRQELEAMKEMARLEQQEYKIRQEISKEKQVASAQREVAKLDPLNDPHYQQSYADIMSKHPLAQDNKFLNEAFTDGARANYRVAQHHLTQLEEGQKQAGKEELAWIKATGAYAAMGGDPSAFTDKNGEHDWNALNAAHAKAVQITKEAAAKDNTGLPITKTVTKEGDTTVTREAPKPSKAELTTAQKIEIAKLEGTHAGQIAQQQFFQKQVADPTVTDKTEAKKNLAAVTANVALSKAQMDAVHQAVMPPPKGEITVTPGTAAVTPAAPTEPISLGDGITIGGTSPPVAATPPVATPPPAKPSKPAATVPPPQAAVEYLKANPHFAPHFDDKYGPNASTEFLTE